MILKMGAVPQDVKTFIDRCQNNNFADYHLASLDLQNEPGLDALKEKFSEVGLFVTICDEHGVVLFISDGVKLTFCVSDISEEDQSFIEQNNKLIYQCAEALFKDRTINALGEYTQVKMG